MNHLVARMSSMGTSSLTSAHLYPMGAAGCLLPKAGRPMLDSLIPSRIAAFSTAYKIQKKMNVANALSPSDQAIARSTSICQFWTFTVSPSLLLKFASVGEDI